MVQHPSTFNSGMVLYSSLRAPAVIPPNNSAFRGRSHHHHLFSSVRGISRRPPKLVEENEDEVEEEDDPGMDLAEAEMDSTGEEVMFGGPVPAPRNPRVGGSYMNMPFPLRSSQSVEAMQNQQQVSTYVLISSSSSVALYSLLF